MPKMNSVVKNRLEKISCCRNKTSSHNVTGRYLFLQEKQDCREIKVAADLGKKIKLRVTTSALILQTIKVAVFVVLTKNIR